MKEEPSIRKIKVAFIKEKIGTEEEDEKSNDKSPTVFILDLSILTKRNPSCQDFKENLSGSKYEFLSYLKSVLL